MQATLDINSSRFKMLWSNGQEEHKVLIQAENSRFYFSGELFIDLQRLNFSKKKKWKRRINKDVLEKGFYIRSLKLSLASDWLSDKGSY